MCGAEALRVDGTRPEPKNGKPARTHWDMLLERRSVKELEVLLAERLELLRRAPPRQAPAAGASARAPDRARLPDRPTTAPDRPGRASTPRWRGPGLPLSGPPVGPPTPSGGSSRTTSSRTTTGRCPSPTPVPRRRARRRHAGPPADGGGGPAGDEPAQRPAGQRPGHGRIRKKPEHVGDEARASAAGCRRPAPGRRRRARGWAAARSAARGLQGRPRPGRPRA